MTPLLIILCLTGLVSLEKLEVTKQEGQTVIFHVNGTQLSSYLWTFGHDAPTNAIAVVTHKDVSIINGTRFWTRLNVKDVDTGSLTISNLTMGDSGVFLIQIFTATHTVKIEYHLTVTDKRISRINVLEGDNVTLKTRVQLEPDHRASWTQGRDFSGKEIVICENNNCKIDEGLKDFLSLDPNSGSLTFVNIIKELSGYFCLRLWKGLEEHVFLQFLISVYEKVPTPQISIKPHLPDDTWSCHINCSVVNKPDVNLTWYKGERVINRTSSHVNSTELCLSLNISSPSEDTYRCEVVNPVCNESVYINTTNWCPRTQTGFPRGRIALYLTLLLLAAVVGGLLVKSKLKDRRRPTCDTHGCWKIQEQNLSHEGSCSQGSGESLERERKDLLKNDPQESYSSFAETERQHCSREKFKTP